VVRGVRDSPTGARCPNLWKGNPWRPKHALNEEISLGGSLYRHFVSGRQNKRQCTKVTIISIISVRQPPTEAIAMDDERQRGKLCNILSKSEFGS